MAHGLHLSKTATLHLTGLSALVLALQPQLGKLVPLRTLAITDHAGESLHLRLFIFITLAKSLWPRMVTCSQGEDVAFLEGHPSACYMHTYLSWHKYLETVWYRNEKGIYRGNSQADSLRFSAGMLAHQLLTRLQKDKKIGVGVQRTETKPFLYSYCIFYLIMQLLIFFLQIMYECIKWTQKIGLAKYLTLWMWKLLPMGC